MRRKTRWEEKEEIFRSTTFSKRERGGEPLLVVCHEAATNENPTRHHESDWKAVLEPAMQGRDMIGRAKMGTGKTLAFGIPIMDKILQGQKKNGPQLLHRRILRAQRPESQRHLELQLGVSHPQIPSRRSKRGRLCGEMIFNHDPPTCFGCQKAVLEPAMQGRDIIGRAKTGTRKTLAFGIPIMDKILQDQKKNG
ncbi:uncharacterized protein A4U43_C07F10220, partial [Asparagus officinalis]